MTTLYVYSNRHVKDQVKNIVAGDWIYLQNGLSRKLWALYFRYNSINEDRLNITYITQEELMNLSGVRFDVVVGNPPYQDNSIKDNQQNKIYNQFSKKAIELVGETGTVNFVTPVAVANLSKRFALTETYGVKEIDFTADKHFNVGAKICSWIVDKTYRDGGDIKVISDAGVDYVKFGTSIFDPSVTDIKFAELAQALGKLPIADRAFKQNIYATASASKEQTEEHIYPLHKLDSNGKMFPAVYVKKAPFFYKSIKLSVSRSKSFREDIIVVGDINLDTQYVNIEIENPNQVENIKSFLFSQYFLDHIDKWKKLYNTGFNDALRYVPLFDKNKKWTNDEVKELFENYVSEI